ncbi:MAG: site-specific integrase, partial [Litorilituus sp.]|nr:site-specific integrase [Litorilituus sp.]
MANIQKRRGKRGTTYRVEFMHEGKRISKSFKTRKEADKFNSNLTLNNDFADGFTNAILSQMTLSEAVIEFLSKYTKKDQSIISRLNFWSESIGELTLNKVTRKQVKNQLNQLEKDGK